MSTDNSETLYRIASITSLSVIVIFELSDEIVICIWLGNNGSPYYILETVNIFLSDRCCSWQI
jgi:hypothetical protein